MEGFLLKPLVVTIVFIIILYIADVVSFTVRVAFVFLCTWINSHFRPDDYLKPPNMVYFVKTKTLENKMVVFAFLCHRILAQLFIKCIFSVKIRLR